MTRDLTSSPRQIPSFSWIAGATLVVAGVLFLAWVAWTVSRVILLLFGAVVVASILHAAAALLERFSPLNRKWALILTEMAVLGLVGLCFYLMGSQLMGAFSNLTEQVSAALDMLSERYNIDVVRNLREQAEIGWLGSLVGIAPNLAGLATSVLLVVVGGIFLAAQPDLYRDGALQLLPSMQRPAVSSALSKAGNAMRLWLLGKLLAMLVIGIVTYVGLLAVGLPSALALALIAGLLEFIPFIGPILSFAPAALIALSQGDATIWWVTGLYLLIQQAENNLLIPLIQQRTVELPPVLGLFSIAILGSLFGAIGVIFAVPLTVVIMVAVKQLYVRDKLGEHTHIPGEKAESD
ncbi:AI-2E family transporter [Devosia salina]|uniref:AI-2E family transporter n=1 Tax=Devosia salina TaxID=2860336 RepID=A0ABX8WBA8_9HYPH|nr:AI-2E family transporter [Devosia salina]QYO76063.1 AI-2E family transporter [Devosia salina]